MNNNIRDFLIRAGTSVKEAMAELDRTAQKILFVVDPTGRLVGSLTDGDIRRWILAGGTIADGVEKACFKNTFFATKDYNPDVLKDEIFKRKIVVVPVLDEGRKIVEILRWDSLFGTAVKRKIAEALTTPVVIMAGGAGARLDPFTKVLPKPLIPVGDKTIIEIIIDKFLAHGVGHFYISINHKAKIIKSFFEELNPPYEVTFLLEGEPRGTAGALKQLEGKLAGPVLMTNCDVIIDTDYHDLENQHRIAGNEITLVSTLKHVRIPYGVCEIEKGGRLTRLKEKPEYNFLVNAGMYILEPRTLADIPGSGPYDITQLIETVLGREGKVGVYPIRDGAWIDTGEWPEYRKAIERLKF